ncbi:MAG: acetyl-CoA acetyltransferase [Candidatus Altiarchaeales archaeon HGW-Altiarchaeales-3]|nr:MAG: acetyl-CoA acetyltransferase [Candidatus Altiarchaeales archaeon HGW-Altiarchaeales-3]
MSEKKVGIIGVGMTKFGEHWDRGYRDLILEAGVKAIEDAGIEGNDIKEIYGGSMSPGTLIGQEHIGALIADYVGLVGIGATRVEAACASGGLALRQAYLSIKSGRNDIVVAGGAEKMTDVPTPQAAVSLAGAGDEEWEAFNGATFPALYAFMAQRHIYEYGTTLEQLSEVAVKSHYNASMNPNAQFPFKVTLEQVMNSAPVALPLRLLHCSPITDGAAIVVLASEEKTRELTDDPVWITASTLATDTLALHDRESLSRTNAAIIAGRKAYEQAKITPEDVDFAEVHDCFSIAEIMAIEALGFCDFGEGGKITENGETRIGGRIPINTSGGLKAKGHPVGATGIAQAIEATLQLRGDAGARQVDNAEIGLAHNVGGSGATCAVHIFSR